MFDWLCYQIVMWLPLHKISPDSALVQFLLPRAGRYANR
jgi:hypothetical protein